jgi:hypothetical protein
MKRSATFTSTDGLRTSQGIATTERMGHLGQVVYVSRGVTFEPDDLESGTLGVLVDRYGDPTEGAPEMLAAARAAGWQATLINPQALIHASRWSPSPRVLVRERGREWSAAFDADGAGA